MNRPKFIKHLPDSMSWVATLALAPGVYFDEPVLLALGFGLFGIMVLAGAFMREPLGWNWIPIRLRYAWAVLLGGWLFLAAIGVAPLFCFGGYCDYVWPQTGGFDISSASEASMNFDQEQVGPFLARVSEIADGLSADRSDRIADEVALVPMDATRQWEEVVSYCGVETTLVLQAFMDDVASPDLYFFTSPELAGAIQDLMEQFAEETEVR